MNNNTNPDTPIAAPPVSEFDRLTAEVTQLRSAVQEFYHSYTEILQVVNQQGAELTHLQQYLAQLQNTQHNHKFEYADPMNPARTEYFYPNFRSDEETLRLIIEENCSLARFGDGEFAIAFQIDRQAFQHPSEALAARIRQVLLDEQPSLLIGIANQYGSLERFNDYSADGIRNYMTDETRAQHMQLLHADRIYSDANISRPYVLWRDAATDAPKQRFEAFARIWQNKRVLIIEGSQTRIGVGNNLLSHAICVRRILGPATNSFDRYDEILQAALTYAPDFDLCLIALGPCAGVLTYDLSTAGIQAIDVGHIDLEYEWFLAGKGVRVTVPHKYNNEIVNGSLVDDSNLPASYYEQILTRFDS